MKLTILISTLNSGIHQVSKIFLDPLDYVHYTVVHQVTDARHRVASDFFSRSDVSLISSDSVGLSRSRNIAMSHARGDIALFADDDVRYEESYFREIIQIYQKDPSLHVACFKIKTDRGEPEYKKYPEVPLQLTDKPPHFISSIEVSFRIDTIKKHQIHFDERFGLGSGLIPGGEEGLFIHDCLKNNLKIGYFPFYIVEHPYQSSTKAPGNNARILTMMGAVEARKRGVGSLFHTFKLTIYKLPEFYRERKNPLWYLFYRLKGNFIILTKKNKNVHS